MCYTPGRILKCQEYYTFCPSDLHEFFDTSGFLKVLSCVLFQEEFLATLNVHKLGFCSLEAFLLVLEQSNMLHMLYEKTKILIYPAAQETELEPEEDNPFPHIMEVRACYRM